MNTVRKCKVCEYLKNLNSDNFYRDKTKKDGFRYTCKECTDRRSRPYKSHIQAKRKHNPVKSRIKYENNRVVYALRDYKKFDKIRGLENDLQLSDIENILRKPCTYCNFPSTGLDRIDNSKGHTKYNCLPCCKDCNIARMNNFTSEEMKIIGESIRAVKLQRF